MDLVYAEPDSTTAEVSSRTVNIYADSTNGTVVYDEDAGTKTTMTSFSSLASSLVGKYVRVTERYQQNGTLVAVRMYVSSTFSKLVESPEGHVLHIDEFNNIMYVSTESGKAAPIYIDSNTQFYFRTPENAQTDAKAIGSGTSWFQSHVLRGFKVHVAVHDVTASTWHADTVDIEDARFAGEIQNTTSSQFTYKAGFSTIADGYSVTNPYISSSTANGTDSNGNAVSGYKWWNFDFPTQLDSGSNAIPDFVTVAGGSVNFGGTVGTVPVYGVSSGYWGDSANPNEWTFASTELVPVPLPLGTVSTGWTTGSTGGTFVMTVPGGANPATIAVSTQSSSATLVYQVTRSGNTVTVTSEDLTNSTNLQTVENALTKGAYVEVFGIPRTDGSVKCYTLFYYTGTLPSK
jgi:hypothetical protein